jgi:ornithine carbamoyltransferase
VLTLADLEPEEILYLVDRADELKAAKRDAREEPELVGRQIVLVFEKTSTRTRCAFEVAAREQGAGVTYLDPTGSQLGHKESIRDTARVLGRMYDGIGYRGFGQTVVEELAEYAGVPVLNGLTDEFHPLQALADVMTMREHTEKPLDEVALCYLGDARNNVANSLLVAGSKLGLDVRLAAPGANWPTAGLVSSAQEWAEKSGGSLLVTEDVEEAVAGADFLYTDVWVSMGEPEEVWTGRIELLSPYRVDARAIELTGNPDVRFLHCLPAFHDRRTKTGEDVFSRHGIEAMEVTDEVFESEHSIVFDQAENRMHTTKAVLVETLAG